MVSVLSSLQSLISLVVGYGTPGDGVVGSGDDVAAVAVGQPGERQSNRVASAVGNSHLATSPAGAGCVEAAIEMIG